MKGFWSLRVGAYLLCFFLAACASTESSRPLLDADAGLLLFDDGGTGLALDKSGQIAVDASGSSNLVEVRREGKHYALTQLSDTKQAVLSIHSIAGNDSLHLLQIRRRGKKSTQYLIARLDGAKLHVDSFIIDEATMKAAQQNGLDVRRKDEYVTTIDNVRSLNELVRLYTQINANSLAKDSGYDRVFAYAFDSAGRQALEASAVRMSCLAHAGHPVDPAVRSLTGLPGYGVPMNRIRTAAAQPVCARAAKLNPQDASVRYALSRAHYQAKNFGSAMAQIDALKAEGFPLAFGLDAQAKLTGAGRTKNLSAAREALDQAKATGSPIGEFFDVIFLKSGAFGAPDYEALRVRLRALISNHDFAHAKTSLAAMLRAGQGGATDPAAALALYQSAVKQRDGFAELGLAEMLYQGEGVAKDHKKAFRLASQAGKAGVSGGQYLAGFMLSRGQGVTKSEKRAVNSFKAAHRYGHIDAGAELGRMLYLGLGAKEDKATGLKLLRVAADNGSKHAQSYLRVFGASAAPGGGSAQPQTQNSGKATE